LTEDLQGELEWREIEKEERERGGERRVEREREGE